MQVWIAFLVLSSDVILYSIIDDLVEIIP